MRNTGLSLAIAVSVLYAAFAGFVFTKTVDESTLAGAGRVIVTGQTTTTGSDGLPSVVQDAAESSNAVVVREIRDLHSSTIRHLYVVIGDRDRPETQWLSDGYPSFSTAVHSIVHPVEELEGVDPRGSYYVIGPPSAVAITSTAFSDLGYDTQTDQSSVSVAETISWFIGGPFSSATLVVMLLIALLSGISVISNVKSYAIQRLHGVQMRAAIKRDLSKVFPVAMTLMVLVFGGAFVGLWFYNGLNQIGSLIQATIIVFLASLVLLLGVHAAAVRLIWDTRLLDGIKGRLGFRVAVPAAYLIRIPGLLMAVSLVAAMFAAAGTAFDAADARADLEDAGAAASITFEAHASPGEMDRLAYESGAWLQEEDEAGRTILAVPLSLSLDGGAIDELPGILLVNRTYLEKNEVFALDGHRVLDAPPGKTGVLIPHGSTTTAADVVNLLGQFASDEPSSVDALAVEQVQSDQAHFLYEPQPDAQQRPIWVRNTVLVVIDPTSGVIRADDYMAYASQGRVLMTDSAEAIRNTPPDLLGPWISAYIPVAQAAADEYATQIVELRIKVACAILALIVLLATAVGLAQIHVRGNAQSILVRHLHGWNFFSIHRWLFVAESVLLAVVCAWAAARAATIYIQQSSNSGSAFAHGADLAVAAWQPWAILLVSVLNLGLLVCLVQIRSHKMIRTQSEETA